VSIAIFDCKGQTVRTIVSGTLAPGAYAASWDGGNNRGKKVAAGSYIVSVTMALQSFSKTLFMAY
jgi:flagellar hook assembly protein FlgD